MEDFLTGWFTRINDVTMGFWIAKASYLASALAPTAKLALIIYIVWIGYKLWFGDMNGSSVHGLLKKAAIPIVVAQTAISLAAYSEFIANGLWSLPEELAGAISGSATPNNAAVLGALYDNFYKLASELWRLANLSESMTLGVLPDLSLTLAFFGTLVTGALIVAVCLFLFTVAKLGIAVMLAIGPLMVLLAAFDATRKFTSAWLGQILSLVFTVLIGTLVAHMIADLLNAYLVLAIERTTTAATPGSEATWPAIISGVAGILLLKQVPSWASALGGGVGLGTIGVGSAIARQVGVFGKQTLKTSSRQAGRALNVPRRGNGVRDIS